MVLLIRKSKLPLVNELERKNWQPANIAHTVSVREPRPALFPLLFTKDLELIEPAVMYLHEHFVQRAHTADTLRTYTEVLQDWFETLEQNGVKWKDADAIDLVAYRNRMMQQLSPRTQKPYSISTINLRVRGVLRFYQWAVRNKWLEASSLTDSLEMSLKQPRLFAFSTPYKRSQGDLFVLRQHESLPRPLSTLQAREILASLSPPYDLIAKWQLYTGLRVSEVLRLKVDDIINNAPTPCARINILRKGPKPGYVIASQSLLSDTLVYINTYRAAWTKRASKRGIPQTNQNFLFINERGLAAGKSTYQRSIRNAGKSLGFPANTHLLRATFACLLLAKLEALAKSGEAINPLLVVKILMGHSHIETTDRYLRAVAVEMFDINQLLTKLLSDQ